MVRGSLISLSLGVLAAVSAQAQSPYGFVVHMTPAGYGGCGDVNDGNLNCDAIVEVGTDAGGPPQFAWVIAYGWEQIPGWPTLPTRGIGGAQFGVNYPEGIDVISWSLCTGGQEIPQNDVLGVWPVSDTGNAVTWPSGEYIQPSGYAKVGFFTVSSGSIGRLTVVGDPRIGFAQFSAGDATLWEIPGAGFSSADVDGSNPDDGRKACSEEVPVSEMSWSKIKSLY